MSNYKLKVGVFAVLIIILLLTIFYAMFGFNLSYLSVDEIKENRTLKEDLISSFKINNIDTVYDKVNNIYYYMIPYNYENQKYTLKLDLDENYKYRFIDYVTNIITVDYEKEYNIIIYNEDNYYESKIVLTNLPLFDIVTDTEITDNDTNSIFKYINVSNLDKVVTYNSKMNIRGATTRKYDKKSYKLKVYDKDYEKEKNINISNFYYGSSFILDATYRDNSKIRNVLSSTLWNEISSDFNSADIYSEFVEVFINNEYKGLYVFTEPVNRKNLNLNKSTLNDTSVIIKSTSSIVPKKSSNFANILEDIYLDYELKYPNNEALYSISWEKSLTKLAKYYDESFERTEENISKIFDINNYIDLIIFNMFINNTDNDFRKNNYFYLKNLNSKLYIQPWDMEFSFGLNYSEEEKYNFLKTMNDYKNISFDLTEEELKNLGNLIVNRYWVLRKSVLNSQYTNKLLDSYINDLNKGATLRDSNLWLTYDVQKEIEDIRLWIDNRIKVLDDYIRSIENE